MQRSFPVLHSFYYTIFTHQNTILFYGNRHCRSILIQKFVQLRLYDLLFLHLGSTDHFSLYDDHIHISKHP